MLYVKLVLFIDILVTRAILLRLANNNSSNVHFISHHPLVAYLKCFLFQPLSLQKMLEEKSTQSLVRMSDDLARDLRTMLEKLDKVSSVCFCLWTSIHEVSSPLILCSYRNPEENVFLKMPLC